MDKQLEKLKDKIMKAVPRIVAAEGVKYFKSRFEGRNKSFDGKKWDEWAPTYKHRTNGSLMVDSSALMGSIRVVSTNDKSVVFSAGNDKVSYAQVHNEGFNGIVNVPGHTRTTKRGTRYSVRSYRKKMRIPKRQFMGDSKELGNIIKSKIEGYINTLN